jgi:hypothetical protein
MAGSIFYGDNLNTSAGVVPISTLSTTSAVTSQINTAIAGISADSSYSTTAYTAAASAAASSTNVASTTVGTVSTIAGAGSKVNTVFIPLTVTTSAQASTAFTVQLTGTTLNFLDTSVTQAYSGTSDVVLNPLAVTTTTANQIQITFGANIAGVHNLKLRLIGTRP